MSLNLDSLQKAILSLQGAAERAHDTGLMSRLDEITQKTIKAGVVQNFEFTYEISCKTMKRWLHNNVGASYVNGLTRPAFFRLAAEHRLIDDVDEWMKYHQARNDTVHGYDEKIAEEVFQAATNFLHHAQRFLAVIEKVND